MAKHNQPHNRFDPRRVESPVRMTVAEQPPARQVPSMDIVPEPMVTEEIPPMQTTMTDPAIAVMFPTGMIEASLLTDAIDEPRPYLSMDTAPRDGTMVDLFVADGSKIRVLWRKTSRFNSATSRWEPTGFWSSPMNRIPLVVDAVGWTLGEGFLTPGVVMA